MKVIQCALCKNKQDLAVLYPASFEKKFISSDTFSARRTPDTCHYRIVRCKRCNLIFSSPIFPVSYINKLYQKSTCTYAEQIPFAGRTYAKLFDTYIQSLPKKPKILEVGCGNGFFLTLLREKGIRDVWGIEPGKKMVEDAPRWLKKRITIDGFKKNQFPAHSFDVICSFHVLDHLTDPNLFAVESFRLLKPGGHVLVVVHDTQGVSVRLFGEKSPIFDIEHIYLFNKTTLASLFINHGFPTPRVFPVVNTYPLNYWLKMSGLPKSLISFGERVLHVFGGSTLPLSFAGGNIGLVVQKPI